MSRCLLLLLSADLQILAHESRNNNVQKSNLQLQALQLTLRGQVVASAHTIKAMEASADSSSDVHDVVGYIR